MDKNAIATELADLGRGRALLMELRCGLMSRRWQSLKQLLRFRLK